MDRDEALKLLRGGEEGIAEWNRRRESGEELPNLMEADLIRANLSGANLTWADFSGANLTDAHLSGANLSEANLSGANLSGANFSEANLNAADLSRANLSGANLNGANLFETHLVGADFRGAHLFGANLSGALMVQVDLRGAKLRDCHIFGMSAWNITTDESTDQVNLIISSDDEPIMTVDNLKVAQFIYLLVKNEEIRDVIDTITSKVVLILGRFSPERKPILDALREELRRRDYLPVMFDFDKPASADIRTPSRRWRGWRFIIADLTDATEVRLELGKIVPELPSVPVQPLVLASARAYVTFDDLLRYPWVLEPFRYEDRDHAIASLSAMIVTPAEAKVTEIRG